MTKLTKNFTLSEFLVSSTAKHKGVENTPSCQEVENIKKLANTMQQLRDYIGKPIIINSGFRSVVVNNLVGGSKTSSHLSGLAADFYVKGVSAKSLADTIDLINIKYDQLIVYPNHVHLGVGGKERQHRFSSGY